MGELDTLGVPLECGGVHKAGKLYRDAGFSARPKLDCRGAATADARLESLTMRMMNRTPNSVTRPLLALQSFLRSLVRNR